MERVTPCAVCDPAFTTVLKMVAVLPTVTVRLVGRTEFTKMVAAGMVTVTVRGVPKTADTLPPVSFAQGKRMNVPALGTEKVIGAVLVQPAALARGGVDEVVIK